MFLRRFLILSVLVLGLGLFISEVKADDRPFGYGNFQCTRHGAQKDCKFEFIDYNSSVDAQLYKFDVGYNYTGYGTHGSMRVDACLSNTVSMWTGACWVVFQGDFAEIFYAGQDSKQIEDLRDITDYNHLNFNVRVNDATVNIGGVAYYRKVSGHLNGPIKVKVGEPYQINWDVQWPTKGAEFIVWSNATEEGSSATSGTINLFGPTVEPNKSGSLTFRSNQPGKAEFGLKPTGPGNNGVYTPEDINFTVIVEATPTPTPTPENQVNLNFTVRDICTNAGIQGATVTIGQDFGNGTTRTTDGSGFANFGVAKNTNINWTIAANGFNTATGDINSGGFGAGVTQSLTRDCGGPPPPPPNPPPPNPPPGEVNLSVTKVGSGTVTSSDNKINCGGTCSANYTINATPELRAVADPGWTFSGWTGECGTVQGNICYMGMTRSKVATATFTQPSGPPPSPGTISVTSKEISTGVPVNTTWDIYYNASLNIREISAISSKDYPGKDPGQYAIQALPEGSTHRLDHIDISPSNQVLTSGGQLTYTIWYAKKSTPISDPTCSPGSQTVNIGQAANFAAGQGDGSYTWSAPGASTTSGTGATFSTSYTSSGTKTVTVTSAGRTASCSVIVNQPPANSKNLNVSVTGPGTVRTADGRINCRQGSTSGCSTTYSNNEAIELSHSEDSGARWVGWGGDCGGSGCIVVMNQNHNVTATFSGTVNPGTGTIVVSTNCNHTYWFTRNGQPTNLGATGGFRFSNVQTGTYTIDWDPIPVTTVRPNQTQTLANLGDTIEFDLSCTRGGGGNEPPPETTAEAVCTVATNARYTLTVYKSGSGSGTISGTGINCGNDCSEAYNEGTVVNLSVSPVNGSTFSGWSGACSGTGSCSVTMNGDKSVTANFDASPSVTSVNVTEPNYCFSGPGGTVSWGYSDPGGNAQSGYQVQIDDQGSFQSPEVDSGRINSNSTAYAIPTGQLQFNITYKARVKVWNSNNAASSWSESGSWKTPQHAYPNPNGSYQYTWTPQNPAANQPVQFTDHTWFDSGSGSREWIWTFSPGGNSSSQNPSYTFPTQGTYQVTESVRDNAMPNGQYCSGPTQTFLIRSQAPKWKEVAPK